MVLPFVPVTPAIGFCGSIRAASSTSPHTGTPAARAAATCGTSSGTPGLFTSARSPSTATGSGPRCTSTPSPASAVASTVGSASVATIPASGQTRADRPAGRDARAAQPDDEIALAHRYLLKKR